MFKGGDRGQVKARKFTKDVTRVNFY